MARIKNTHKTRRFYLSWSYLPISWILISLLLLSLGLIRGELAANLAGLCMLTTFLHSCTCTLLALSKWKNIPLSCTPMSNKTLVVSIPKFPSSPFPSVFPVKISYCPEYVVDNSINPAHNYSPTIFITHQQQSISYQHLPRGLYTPVSHRIVISDYLGLCNWKAPLIHDSLPPPFTINPIPLVCKTPPLPIGTTGILRGSSTFLRSDNLYEIRPYHTGDDPRKINWKVYAHTGDLSVREGELLPPPSSEYIFIINQHEPRKNNSSSYKDASKRFDILLSKVAHLALSLLDHGHLITIQFFGEHFYSTTIHPMDEQAHAKILDSLSQPALIKGVMKAYNVSFQTQGAIFFVSLPDQLFPSALFEKHHKPSTRLVVLLGPASYSQSPIKKTLMNFLFCLPSTPVNQPQQSLNYSYPPSKPEREGLHAYRI